MEAAAITGVKENQQEQQQPVSELNNEAASEEVTEVCGDDSKQQFVMAILSVPFLVISAFYLKFALNSTEPHDKWRFSAVAGVFLAGFLFFVYRSCTSARLGFNPSLMWGAMIGRYTRGGQRTGSSDGHSTSIRQGDIESQDSAESESRPVDSSTSAAAGEKDSLVQTSASKSVCKVKNISEVAMSISKIALETVAEKGESMESSSDFHTADENPEPAKTDSDSELLSSGEVRRRKLGEGKETSNSSDEEPIKKN